MTALWGLTTLSLLAFVAALGGPGALLCAIGAAVAFTVFLTLAVQVRA